MLPNEFNTKGKTLYLDEFDTLVASDIHFGKCRTPKFNTQKEYKKKYNRLQSTISELEVKTLILNGDTFYNPFIQDWNPLKEDDAALELLENLQESVDEFVLLEGNHELTLGKFTDNIKEKFNTDTYYSVSEDILVYHGHSEPPKNAEHHIIGHLHPLRDSQPVFQYCEEGYQNSSVTVLPAFCNFVDGVDIRYYGGRCPVFEEGVDAREYKYLMV